MTSYAVRVYLELTAHASASIIVITGLTANNATAQWRVTLAGTGAGAQTGQIRITNGAGTTQASSGSSVIPLNQVVRLEAVIQSGAFTATAYSGDTNTVIATATATTVTTVDMDAVRFGPFSTAPTVPTFYLDDFALSDTAALIGPPSPAPSGATWSLWNGTSEVPLSLEGVWNGTSVTPLSFDRVI
ncbi:hypothetical protein AB0G06_43615 [Nonomuraea dietziae]|uniref:hypothetical protein n=1 Tax=Nonomuraea dietziae TaxID=65515 RepID=UPI0033DD8EFC